MVYIGAIIAIGIFFLALHYFTELNNSDKFSVIAIVLSLILGAMTYNEYTNQESQKKLDVTMKFNQGKSLMCDGFEVNSSNYTLSTGTYTFIGRENTPNYSKMISASTCE